jgi:predicted nuclease of restriction endonuclease-like (RecB) superfamily
VSNDIDNPNKGLNPEFDQVCQTAIGYVEHARQNVLKSVNHEQTIAYWKIGRLIVETEQQGKERAGYGTALLKTLSERLTREFKRGFSLTNIKYMRIFYQTFRDRIRHQPGDEFELPDFNTNLSWTHYRLLMSESREEVRNFYEIEAAKNHWSVPQLKRQIHSSLYERLAASRDEKGVMKLANEGQVITTPEEALKDPVVLDFLGYKEHHKYTEHDLESGIIDHLQEFLLEMGRGFAFVGRQKRLTISGKHYYPDLVFFHTVLRCYIIVDCKIVELEHGDVGQMMLYVNYYDRDVRLPDDNPTIGLLLCPAKDDAVVKYMTPKDDKQIFARKYQFHLPTVEELKKEVSREYEQVLERLSSESDDE